MRRALPTELRQAAEAVTTFMQHGVLFVPMPATSEADYEHLKAQVIQRLDNLALLEERKK